MSTTVENSSALAPGYDQPRYQPLVLVASCAASGIVLDRWLGISLSLWWVAAVTLLGLWIGLRRAGWDRAAAACVLLAVAAVGGAWHHQQWHLFDRDELGLAAREEGGPVCFEAVAVSRPRHIAAPPPDPMRNIPRGDRTELFIQLTGVRHLRNWQPAAGQARMLIDGHLLGVDLGDRLRVFGRYYALLPAMNPGEFDYALHRRADRYLFDVSCSFPDCVMRVDRPDSWSFSQGLSDIRAAARRVLWRHLDERRAPLAEAVLLGGRDTVDPETAEAFFETGAVHLLVVSGLHVGILAGGLFFLARLGLVSRKHSLLLVAVTTILYALLAEARPPVVRATVLVVVVCLGLATGRRSIALNSLAAAALVVLWMNPAELFRPGTQLSFLAVAALIWFGPGVWLRAEQDPLRRHIAETRPWPTRAAKWIGGKLWALVLAGAVIWAVTLPLIMFRFHLFSPISMVVNVVSWIPMTVALLFGFATMLVSWLVPPLGAVCGWICNFNLSLIENTVLWGHQVTGGHTFLPGPAPWWVAGFYGGLFVVAVVPQISPPARWRLGLLAVWIIIGFWQAEARRAERLADDAPLDCTFVSVGHGTSTLLELPGGKTLLYDAGRLGSPRRGAWSIGALLWSRGITHVDAVVLSHADADHYNALPELLKRFSVGVVYVSPMMFQKDEAGLRIVKQALDDAGVPLKVISAGSRLSSGGAARIEVLHPAPQASGGRDNSDSLVLLVEYQGRRLLLPGDLEPPGLDHVMEELPIDCDAVMAPHHGSARSNPEGFAAWCSPEYVVISGGHSAAQNVDQVIGQFEAAGAQVLTTSKAGAVRVRIYEGEVEVAAWRERDDQGW